MSGLHSATTRSVLQQVLRNNTKAKYIILDRHPNISSSLTTYYDYIIFLVSVRGGGHHWLCAKVDNNKRTVRIFDSYGLDPEHNSYYDVRECIRDPNMIIHHCHNFSGFQSKTTSVCGEYCVAFIVNNGSIDKMRNVIGLRDASDILKSDTANHGNNSSERAIRNDKHVLLYFKHLTTNKLHHNNDDDDVNNKKADENKSEPETKE